MNHSYRLVWSDASQRHVPAPETARGRGKGRAGKALAPAAVLLGALLALPSWAQAPPATTLPTGGQVVSGQARIGQSGAQMTIDQSSQKAILQWQGFDIGSQAKVQFNQPNASAVALNRVVAGNASRIHGRLNANGQVWLVNPNGVVFGQGSRVDVGGLVASTLDITNEDFNAGRQRFTRGTAQGGISQQGEITAADGGLVALLAPTVKNDGAIRARLGNVVLAAGDKVTLEAGAGGGWLQVAVDGATVNTLIENNSMIIADGGQVVMTAKAADALSSSVVSMGQRGHAQVQANALAERAGRILLLGDMQHGEVVIDDGYLIASGSEASRKSGFVETSAAKVRIGAEAFVVATGSDNTGNWLIRGKGLTIDAGSANAATSSIAAEALSSSLSNSHAVTLQAVGSATDKGDIHVNAPLGWARNRLTLNAPGDIHVNAVMTASDSAVLEMNYGGYSATQQTAAAGSGVHMALTESGFAGRVDFTGRDGTGASTNQLKINGDRYTLITRLGSEGSTTGADLQGINGRLDGRYALAADLDANATAGWDGGAGWVPIGQAETAFTGRLDGLGHRITGLTVNRPEQSFVGLLGNAMNATLRNVGLENARVKGNEFVGGLVGRQLADSGATAAISHVYVSGQIAGEQRVGGLVGMQGASDGATARIDYVHASVQVDGDYQVAGLVGYNEAGAEGTVRIDRARVSGQVTGRGQFAGGLVGSNGTQQNGKASISNAHASGSVSADIFVGGLVGGNQGYDHGTLSIDNASASGEVTGDQFVGGLVGYNAIAGGSTSRIAQVHASGRVRGDYHAGGLVGFHDASDGTAIISQAYATGQVDGVAHLGGLVGINSAYGSGTARIEGSFATGQVSGTNNFVGGLVGRNSGTAGGAVSIANAYASGQVLIVGERGIYDGGQKGFEGQVDTGDNAVGGLVGRNEVVEGGTARILHSYATGRVVGRGIAGGLVGESDGVIQASFYATTQVDGTPVNTGSAFNTLGQGHTWAELTRQSTYAGWDIDDQGGTGRTWRIYDGLATPWLRSFLRPLTVTADTRGVVDKNYDGRIASGPMEFTTDMFGAALSGQLGYTSSGSLPGRYAVADGSLRIGGLYSGQLGYDIRYVNIADLALAIKDAQPRIQAGDFARNACSDLEVIPGRRLSADGPHAGAASDSGPVRWQAVRSDTHCVPGHRWASLRARPAGAEVPMLQMAADFIRVP